MVVRPLKQTHQGKKLPRDRAVLRLSFEVFPDVATQ